MISTDHNFERPTCLVCHVILEERVSCDYGMAKKVVHNCNKYLHCSITENCLMEKFNSKTVPPNICPTCFESALRLSELDDQSKIIQKSINDLLFTFSVTILHRRAKKNNWRPTPKVLEIDITNFHEFSSDSDISELDPLLINFPEAEKSDKVRNNEIKIERELLNNTNSEYICGDGERNMVKNTIIDNEIVGTVISTENSTSDYANANKNSPNNTSKEIRVSFERVPSSLSEHRQPDISKSEQLVNKCFKYDAEVETEQLFAVPVGPSTDDPVNQGDNRITRTTGWQEKTFVCVTCTKAFIHRSSLMEHIRIHTGEKPFKCAVCTKAFRRRTSLNEHIRIHTGEKPFQCPKCPRAFTQKNHLVTHIMRIHKGHQPH